MSEDEYGRVPAGWYPDPLGLPQLRWWDNHAWTEHVSDARQPMVAQPAPTTFADDDELPTRRARRSAESATDAGETIDDRPLAHVLKALPAPTTVSMPALVEPDIAAPSFAPEPVVEPVVEPLIAPEPEFSSPQSFTAAPAFGADPFAADPFAASEPAPFTPQATTTPPPFATEQTAAPQPAAQSAQQAPQQSAPRTEAPRPAANPGFDIPTSESAMRDAQWIPMQEPREQQPANAPGPVSAASAVNHSSPGSVPGAPSHGGWQPYGGDPRSAQSAGHYSAAQTSAPHPQEQWGGSPYYAQHALFQDSAPQHPSAARYGSAPGTGSAAGWGSVPGAPQYVPYVAESPVAAMRRGGMMPGAAGPVPHVHTGAAWAIALLPMVQLLLSLLVVAAFTSGLDLPIITAIWLAPIPVVIALAYFDQRSLKRRGIDRPAGWWWSIIGAPVYLIMRAVSLARYSGAGFAPAAVFLLLVGLQVGAIVAVPGLLISAVPQLFADEASNSIELNARSIGTAAEVTCSGTPPLFIGQQYRCPAVNADGTTFVVTVSLQRANGWITWQVDDWGVYSLTE
ncbi:DUF2510 domain-containing protein [Yonghaparkia sp. Soil809]|uniref:DUF2510 domain-containing protein n=1 Tax=Yonghaparkia sp. Soil809 TaxID=1736417 RepID=UPI000AFDEBE3|nr:DUF2510 domain-containing protein [Yonghaparkia sp. Soil809]